MRIANLSGTPVATLFMWNAEDTSERFNASGMTKLRWTTNLTTGRLLFSDMGRVLASIVTDTGFGHYSIVGPRLRGHFLR